MLHTSDLDWQHGTPNVPGRYDVVLNGTESSVTRHCAGRWVQTRIEVDRGLESILVSGFLVDGSDALIPGVQVQQYLGPLPEPKNY